MERIYDRCCGIDVHKKLTVACFRQGSRQEVREFGVTAREPVRYRKSLAGERNREPSRLQKMLEGANIKLSGIVRDINGMSARNFLEHILSGKEIDSAEYDLLYEKKVIAHNLKATKEQIIDGLNGFVSELQRKMMRILLRHLDGLNGHISELDDGIDSFIKPEEKRQHP